MSRTIYFMAGTFILPNYVYANPGWLNQIPSLLILQRFGKFSSSNWQGWLNPY